ncbi:DUF305 domain-containing protein [Loktanella sp. M215]|uniref:DUF305 domain-containing protein n=1 Tax=Loktanella sp. M215 TaxID=2675431 RepID=UPI001F1FEFBB|nr:DUF305 domain-containing protein [Loktanella sp. M215]MCF7701212.1 DUF305 domain-containing protein [Loktanella sp. M215]
MSTATGAIAGVVLGAAVGIGGMMVWQHGTLTDHDGMAMDHGDMPVDHAGMAGMGDMPMTGNPDHDFMAGMVPHHESAVEMAQVVLRTTEDPEVKALAENILATQKGEIDQMNAWLAANPQ